MRKQKGNSQERKKEKKKSVVEKFNAWLKFERGSQSNNSWCIVNGSHTLLYIYIYKFQIILLGQICFVREIKLKCQEIVNCGYFFFFLYKSKKFPPLIFVLFD